MEYSRYNGLNFLSMRYIQVFLAAAELENFSAAAAELKTTQPLVSRTIAYLESEMKLRLFIRDRKRVTLTPAGRLLYARWHKFFLEMQLSVEDARIQQQNSQRRFVVCDDLSTDKNRYLLPVLHCFGELYPRDDVAVEQLELNTMVDKLTCGAVDVSFTFLSNTQHLDPAVFQRLEVLPSRMYALVHESRPLFHRESLSLADLQDEPIDIIDRSRGSGYYDSIMRMFAAQGLKPKINVCHPNTFSFQFARETGNVTTLSSGLVPWPTRRDMRMIPIRDTSNGLLAVWRRDNADPRLQNFLKVLRDCIQDGSVK